jgi:hypothetical protein
MLACFNTSINLEFERDMGVEPISLPWEGSIEPLN